MLRVGLVITESDPPVGADDPPITAADGCQTSHVHRQADTHTAQHDLEPSRRCQAYRARWARWRLLRRYFFSGPRWLRKYWKGAMIPAWMGIIVSDF